MVFSLVLVVLFGASEIEREIVSLLQGAVEGLSSSVGVSEVVKHGF